MDIARFQLETKYDKKGRLRAEGYRAEIVPEEAKVIKRIFTDFVNGKAVTAIEKELNTEKVPSRKNLKGGWNVSTLSSILKKDKYTGKYTWNKTTYTKDPISGKRKQIQRPKSEWVTRDVPEMRVISDELWEAAQKRWKEIENTYPSKTGKRGFESQQKSYVSSHPPHLLSGALKCGVCKSSITLVSGKGNGYYGCQMATRKRCTNKTLISRKRLESLFMGILYEKVLTPEVLEEVYKRTAKKIKEQFSHIPEEIRLRKIELNREETRITNFINFIAEGRATSSISTALEEAEKKAKELKIDLESLSACKEDLFEPPPKEWIAHRLKDIQFLLEKRTEQSALILRRLIGMITLTPKVPEVGRTYYQARCKLKSFALLEKLPNRESNRLGSKNKKAAHPNNRAAALESVYDDKGSNSLTWSFHFQSRSPSFRINS